VENVCQSDIKTIRRNCVGNVKKDINGMPLHLVLTYAKVGVPFVPEIVL
jgi:hypothetical protein